MSGPADFTRLSRRAALATIAAPAAALTAGPARAGETTAQIAQPGPGVCVLAPEAVEGPFYYDPALVRSDITEGRPGVPLELRLTLIERRGCAPIANARLDIWHCDAAGEYSGFPAPPADGANQKRDAFMRGTQMSGANGVATFHTIYPGWYPGRTPHIHLKAFLDDRNVLTTQLYFPDALSEYIYENVPTYAHRTKRDTTNTSDGVLAGTENARSTFLAVTEEADRYLAALTVAVDRDATSVQRRRGPPPPPGAGGPPPPGDRRGPPPGEGMGSPRPRPSGPLVPGA